MTKRERLEIVKKCQAVVSKFPEKFRNNWLITLAKLADESGPIRALLKEIEKDICN